MVMRSHGATTTKANTIEQCLKMHSVTPMAINIVKPLFHHSLPLTKPKRMAAHLVPRVVQRPQPLYHRRVDADQRYFFHNGFKSVRPTILRQASPPVRNVVLLLEHIASSEVAVWVSVSHLSHGTRGPSQMGRCACTRARILQKRGSGGGAGRDAGGGGRG